MPNRKRLDDTCPKCGSKSITYIEYPPNHPEHYDGVSEIECFGCNIRFGRWSGKELAKGEYEKVFGGKQD